MQHVSKKVYVPRQIAGNRQFHLSWKKTIETITEFVMVLIVIMGIVLVLMQAVIVPAGLYW